NATALAEALRTVAEPLLRMAERLEASPEDAERDVVELMRLGRAGRALLPGKHGRPPVALASVLCVVPDEPGGLARLSNEAAVGAIDGPSGSGKATVARGVARALDLRYLDTGAMYRALTWLALHEGVPLDDAAALAALAEQADLVVTTAPEPVTVHAAGHDVT